MVKRMETQRVSSDIQSENFVDCPTNSTRQDGGWGWIVCGGTFIVNFVVFGIHNSFGVVYVKLLEELKLGEVETAWIGAMAMGLNFFCGPISSALCDRFGCRVVSIVGALLSVMGLFLTSFIEDVYMMYLTYGLVWGVGSSFSFVSSIVILGQYFSTRLALANGIATSGSGVGSLVAGPVINYLLDNVGWKNSMRILSAFATLLAVAPVIFRPGALTETNDGEPKEKRKLFDTSIWQNKAYVAWVITVALFQFGYLIPFVHLVKYAEDLGIARSKGAWLIGFLSITSTFGRIFFGKLSDMNCVNRLHLYQFSTLVIGISTALCPLAINYAGLVSYALVFGFFDGCFVGQVAVITADIVGYEKLSQAVGNMFGVLAIPMSLGPPFAGWLYHIFGSYNDAFYVAGSVAVFSSLLIFIVPCLIKKERRITTRAEILDCLSCTKCEQDKRFSLNTSRYSPSLESQPMLAVEEKHKLCERHMKAMMRLAEMTVVVDKETVL